ncbi:hypothetical protein Q9L58_010901, partial [Maublancomyces gigas]
EWTSEINKIVYEANLCEEKAAGFALRYINRMEYVRGERVHPEFAFWNNFVIHLKTTFTTEEVVREAKQLMRELKYTNIPDYLRECQSVNLTIRQSGDDWREEVELILPRKIIHVVGRSGKFANDEQWVEEVLRVGLREQTTDRQDKLGNTGIAATDARGKQHEKRVSCFEKKGREQQLRKEAAPALAASSSHPPPQSKFGKDSRSTVPPGKDDSRPILFTNWKTAHGTITQELIDKRRKAGGCSRCGRTGCFWKKCDAKEPRTISATTALKRKREDNGEESSTKGALEKKMKAVPKKLVATVSSALLRTRRGVHVQNEWSSSSNIYPQDSDIDMSK